MLYIFEYILATVYFNYYTLSTIQCVYNVMYREAKGDWYLFTDSSILQLTSYIDPRFHCPASVSDLMAM